MTVWIEKDCHIRENGGRSAARAFQRTSHVIRSGDSSLHYRTSYRSCSYKLSCLSSAEHLQHQVPLNSIHGYNYTIYNVRNAKDAKSPRCSRVITLVITKYTGTPYLSMLYYKLSVTLYRTTTYCLSIDDHDGFPAGSCIRLRSFHREQI